ncbi:aldolase [Lindgomyces ingoldianus]|uniref:Aldolase n=1 Tax=Lindgomyces ingoldianus TaxID=673940 RepID=A0ACB6QJL1_9PLEO|nr:aldolase [Lindgomyces ingoldianus]KAF2467204.1 aldolase [Lindgomyces ingoldianus]
MDTPTEPAPFPTKSQTLIWEFLAANPALDAELGDIEVMTDRYTNEEWATQIAETVKKVQADSEARGKKKYEAPAEGSKELAETIDHTILKLDATSSQIDALCSEARTEGFKSVCVRLNYVQRCISNLKGSPVVVACVVGFHEGTQDTYSKLREARAAVEAGASELDVVLNYKIITQHSPSIAATSHKTNPSTSTTASLTASNTAANSKPHAGDSTPAEGPYSMPSSTMKSNQQNSCTSSQSLPVSDNIPNYSFIFRELASLRSLCPSPITLKLILETSQLTPPQILAAAHLAAAANFDFIKTSTGFNGRGASLADVELMVTAAEYLSTTTESNGGSPVCGRKMQVKASGGIRSLADATKMLEAGATRLGTSSGLWIMQEGRKVVEEKEGRRPGGVSRLYTDDDSAGGY